MEFPQRQPMSTDEFIVRMRDAGYEDWEIKEELAEREVIEERHAANTSAWREEQATTLPPRHIEIVNDSRDVEDSTRRKIEVEYGFTQIPIHISLPISADFDPKMFDFEPFIHAAFKQCHGKNYESIHVELDAKGVVKDVGIERSGAGQPFERIRRITGYLVGDMSRFNDAKATEVAERVTHGVSLGGEVKDALAASTTLQEMDTAAALPSRQGER